MKLLSKTNTKTKILILIIWTVILVLLTLLVSFLVSQTTKKDVFANFESKPYDDVVSLSVTMKENRVSSIAETNQTNDMETSKYSFVVYLTKTTQVGYSYYFKYLSCHLTVKTQVGEYVYENSKKGNVNSSSTSNSFYNSSTTFTFNNVLDKKISNKSTSVTTLDETPEEIYVQLYYILNTKDSTTSVLKEEEKIIEYKTKVSNLSKLSYNTKDSRTDVKTENESEKGNIESKDNEIFKLNMLYDPGTIVSTERVNYTDDLQMILKANTANLNNKSVNNMSFEIVGKLKNDKSDENNKFVNYVYLGSYYGVLPRTNTITTLKNSIDTIYEMKEIYVFASFTLSDGSKESVKFVINVSDLSHTEIE